MEKVERILRNTPFNTYSDLFGAVFNNKARIRLTNNACRQIAASQKPLLSNLGIYFGIIPSAIITIVASVYSSNYFLLLLLPLVLILPLIIYFLGNLGIKTWYIAAIAVLVDLFIVRLPSFVLIFFLCWLICLWVVSWWKKKLFIISIKILQCNEDAFEWAYNSHNLLIEDCYGNTYSKLHQERAESAACEKLLKILSLATGLEGADDIVDTFSSFYLEQGLDIPSDLYLDIAHLSKQEKCQKLLKILEIGTGVTGIENVTSTFIAHYQSNGVDFPDDVL